MKTAEFYKDTVNKILKNADIIVNGSRPWDIEVKDDSFYNKVFSQGSLGLGESYMNGLWSCQDLDEFMFRVINGDLANSVSVNFKTFIYVLRSKLFNLQTVRRSRDVAIKHYDIGNELYENMLDKRMIYSCAYWEKATSLEEAQEEKLDLICRKLKLLPGQKVLDIGCGWGGFAKFAAEKYQVEVVGITISEEQAKLARKICEDLPVTILVEDYRNLTESFDRVVSIGMFEHVGYKNYETYMKIVHGVLKKDGLFLLHCIGSNQTVTTADPWINKYIFPNGMIPSVAQIGKAIENKFILEDWQNIGPFYDRTLIEWLNRFKNAWPSIRKKYDERFYKMWVYYLSCCAASFRAKRNDLWQIVFSRVEDNVLYKSVR
jgi:cyclopropane-fatty-acyl-phospholipid synthase